jgi:hypothetical protein
VIVMLAVTLGMAATARTAGTAIIFTTTCHASNYEEIDGECLQIAHTEPLSPATRPAFEKAFSRTAGRAAMEKHSLRFRSLTLVQSERYSCWLPGSTRALLGSEFSPSKIFAERRPLSRV